MSQPAELVFSDGLSRLVIERDPNGRIRITVNDRNKPGFTITANRADSAIIAEFIREGS
ncbi:hypothetical protein [Nocardia sp. NPDC057440]|uniref:hypothetical protein n=1 Tax=Nocardia sp. NPDC057440 TaxID=3346134 RepID=UPI00366EFEBF